MQILGLVFFSRTVVQSIYSQACEVSYSSLYSYCFRHQVENICHGNNLIQGLREFWMKHVALFVIGHSPAIVTETLAASVSNPPDVVRVCTTASGAKLLHQTFFTQAGWGNFQQAYPCYQNTLFDASCITVPKDLNDIRSSEDNQHMAQAIFEMVQWAVQDSSMISASIAGGRKTMGYLLGFAMSLFARPQDRLTHVLVPSEWERDRGFLFPEPNEAQQVTLVDIPFVRLGKHLKAALANADIKTLVASAQTSIDISAMDSISLHIRSQTIAYLGKTIQLSDREFAFYQFFVEQKLKHCHHTEATTCESCTDCFLSYEEIDQKKEDLLLIRSQFGGINSGNYVRFEKAWRGKHVAATNVHEPLRRIAESIEALFGTDPRAERLMIRNVGQKGVPSYGLLADKVQLSVERE